MKGARNGTSKNILPWRRLRGHSFRFGTETEAVRAGIRMLADYETKLRALRRDIGAADADIAAGLGKEYGSGADLLKDVMQEN